MFVIYVKYTIEMQYLFSFTVICKNAINRTQTTNNLFITAITLRILFPLLTHHPADLYLLSSTQTDR